MIKTINEAIEDGWEYFVVHNEAREGDPNFITFSTLQPIEEAYNYEGDGKMYLASAEGFKPRIPSGKDIASILAEVFNDMLYSDTNFRDDTVYNAIKKLDLDDVSEKMKGCLKYIRFRSFPQIELIKTYAHIKQKL